MQLLCSTLVHMGGWEVAARAPQFDSDSLFSWHSPTRTVFHQVRGPRASQEATLPLLGFPGHPTAMPQALVLHQQTHRRLRLVQNPILFPRNPAHLLQSLCYTSKGIRGNTTFPVLLSQVYLEGVYLAHKKTNYS